MKSGAKLFFTILYLAMFAKIFAKSVDIYESDESDASSTEHPPTTEPPLEVYKPEITSFSKVSYITTITAFKHFNQCPAIIIARRYVVTAADCVNEYKAEDLSVRDTVNEANILVKNIIFSEIYSEKDQLAVLELDRPLNIQIEPISLISKDELEKAIEEEINALTVGFMLSTSYGPLVAKLKLYPEKVCNEKYRQMLTEADKYDFIETLHFCFHPMKNGFVSRFDGGAIIINGKLAGIKIHNKPRTNNSLYCKINIFEEFLNQFIGEEEIITTTQSSTEEHDHPGSYACPELEDILEQLEKLFKALFGKLVGTVKERVNRSDILTNMTTSDRVSTRNGGFQSNSESILEFDFSVRPSGLEDDMKELVIEHFSKPYFYIKITDERLYLRVVKDESLIDPQFWSQRLHARVARKRWDDEIIEEDVDIIPYTLFDIIASTLFMYTFNFIPSLIESLHDPELMDISKSLYLNLNLHLNLN